MKVPIIFRGEVEIDQLPTLTPTVDAEPYYTRSTAPEGARGRTWDAAVVDLTAEGKCFRPGLKIMIRRDDLHAWIEKHGVKRDEPADDADDPIDFAEFKRTALRPPRDKRAGTSEATK
jgi:hypothetical protein